MKKISAVKFALIAVFVLLLFTDFAGLADLALMVFALMISYYFLRIWLRGFMSKKRNR